LYGVDCIGLDLCLQGMMSHCVAVEVHPHVETGHGVFGTAIYFTEMHVLPA
jgi:hypothetical protein